MSSLRRWARVRRGRIWGGRGDGGKPEVFWALAQESQPPARDERPGGLQGNGCHRSRRSASARRAAAQARNSSSVKAGKAAE